MSGKSLPNCYDTEIRDIHSDKLLAMWREEAGEFPGVERITYGVVGVGPGGKAIEFKLLAASEHVDQLLAATEAIKDASG